MPNPENVEAEIIEAPSSELQITKAVPGSAIESNVAAVKAWVDQQLATYSVPCIKTESDFKQAKRDRTALRAMGKSVDDARKHVKQLYTAPLVEFEQQVKAITDPIKTLDASMKAAVDSWDSMKREKRRAELEAHYRELAPMLAEAVPYERLHDEKWLNSSLNLMTAMEELDAKAEKVGAELEQLGDMELTHPVETKARFIDTLDIGDALRYDAELAKRERAVREMESERDAMRHEQEVVHEPEPVIKPSKPGDAPCAWTMSIDSATREQCVDIGRYCGSLGVTGRFTMIKEGRSGCPMKLES